jgi:putative transposase
VAASCWLLALSRSDFNTWEFEGYAAFSVSVSNTPVVAEYIRNQEKHHRKISFQDEYLALLKKHGIEFDPMYIFA